MNPPHLCQPENTRMMMAAFSVAGGGLGVRPVAL